MGLVCIAAHPTLSGLQASSESLFPSLIFHEGALGLQMCVLLPPAVPGLFGPKLRLSGLHSKCAAMLLQSEQEISELILVRCFL